MMKRDVFMKLVSENVTARAVACGGTGVRREAAE
jgi:hypothetical protein